MERLKTMNEKKKTGAFHFFTENDVETLMRKRSERRRERRGWMKKRVGERGEKGEREGREKERERERVRGGRGAANTLIIYLLIVRVVIRIVKTVDYHDDDDDDDDDVFKAVSVVTFSLKGSTPSRCIALFNQPSAN